MPLFATDKDRRYALLGLRIVGDFGASIAVPVILFVLIGQWLDDIYQQGYWFTIFAFVLAAAISARMIYKKAKAYGTEFQNMDKEK
ncbi:MAG: hypothetical protein A2821_03870 [Candidatus Magasanikbacteria bacterium RIFCSPHIGHO2_01_FULL_41_23]|uniref:Uncharacterized protein n=1 Tax=Candidatus Magasanikbacteria bacterium RIFCSPLOWO2_01_FULL_40_15 TaxID=1798686 RepID=A0A1F6N2K9_9BACT|nr:MAG: hypothetical protein A2821_03870 [Candidatus Magasanikbacteria bacterium RIFCSPHIGHO2_01_FULL_41_23]OGH66953.1 MAG: hypothetical protein A3C66_00410 [Candidatus Magasanikbacteria bacterium RIFCSPHIGHO2_02_FULL_41_35]OGH74934.1 MAG: hypothetical protein A3F22_02545 [Candidatus Magasanikbacteria bacterium RIFCSPHIGHO2_12_FULL_41_16]OGH78236.1 MAG: hypothetical protein A2983_02180 [Candidatus Magasanikbacteria bacterium RIFCSPLOWO2_01_FULL_40_15]